MRPISVHTDSIDFSLPSEYHIISWRVLIQLAHAERRYSRMLWCGYQQAAMTLLLHFLRMGPVPPMMTKVPGKWLFEAVGFCSVWFNFVISNQIKGLKGVFPMRNVGQTSHICVGLTQHAHWLPFLLKPLNPQSDWMPNGSTNRRSGKRGLYLVSHQDKSYWGWTAQGWIWHVCICLIQLKLSLLIIGNFKLLTNAKPWPDLDFSLLSVYVSLWQFKYFKVLKMKCWFSVHTDRSV